ncbi:MAG: hypothetical protein FD123_1493 [Bacteroidetes bacterium]|nr:MAG: hypothetical protein FD123_1493 [Bacteroidota bacterium]
MNDMPCSKKNLRFGFFLLILALSSCIMPRRDKYVVREQPAQQAFAPERLGIVWLRDSLWIDQCEVRNIDWQEFLYWLKREEETELHREMLPDTLVWRKKLALCEPYVEYYFRHPAYHDYPMVGITLRQAEEYCKWRSARVNEFIAIQKGLIKNRNPDSNYVVPQYVRYRIPTKAEWESAAMPNYVARPVKKTPFPRVTDRRGEPVNLTREFQHYESIVAPVKAGQPNYYGLYQVNGNVSELVSDSGGVMGLNYKTGMNGIEYDEDKGTILLHPDTSVSKIYPGYRHTRPESWIGFRCVCDVLILPDRKKQ